MPKISRQQILQDFRTRSLLEATRRLIAQQGFDAVTMEHVARVAGITKGGIYLYFRNKDEMILAAVEETAAEMGRRIEERVNARSESWGRLLELIRAQMAIMEENRELLRTLLIDRRQAPIGRGQLQRRGGGAQEGLRTRVGEVVSMRTISFLGVICFCGFFVARLCCFGFTLSLNVGLNLNCGIRVEQNTQNNIAADAGRYLHTDDSTMPARPRQARQAPIAAHWIRYLGTIRLNDTYVTPPCPEASAPA